MLQHFGENIWIYEGSTIGGLAGFVFPTRMVIIRLINQQLFVWSPINLDDSVLSQLSPLGTVAALIAPNSLHYSYLPEWAARFPEASIYGAPGVSDKVPRLSLTDVLGNEAPHAWRTQIEQVLVPGNAITDEVVFFHRDSGTVIFTDLLQQYPKTWFRGWRGAVARIDKMTEAVPTVPRKFRLAFRDKTAARKAVRRILDWPAERVVMAHGAPVTQDAQTFLRSAFGWLRP